MTASQRGAKAMRRVCTRGHLSWIATTLRSTRQRLNQLVENQRKASQAVGRVQGNACEGQRRLQRLQRAMYANAR